MIVARRTVLALSAAAALGLTAYAHAASGGPQVGKPAPAFTAVDSKGQTVKLADLRGKTVVLEWTNHDCPYVRKHYNSGNMQKLQSEAANDGVVWLSVISSMPGSQGHVSGDEADALTAKRKAAPTHVLIDEKGAIGMQYGARVTPHMYVINAEGTLVYMGGIDDKPTASVSDVNGATNYVREALAAVKKGEAVPTTTSRPYGCSIKYQGA